MSRRGARVGAWRAVAAAPLAAGGFGVVTLVAGGAGRWAGLLVAGWLAVAVLLLTPAGERVGVAVLDGYRVPRGQDRVLVARLLARAAARCGPDAPRARVYVRCRVGAVNAYAAGRASVAVSAGFLAAARSGALGEGEASAMLVHELGHLAGRGTRYGLAIAWLTLPWRAAAGLLGRLLRGIVGHVPTARAALVLVPVLVTVAGVQLVRAGAWAPLGVLGWLAVVLLAHPVADAALARAGERAADAYTAAHGAGPDLAAALRGFPDRAGRARPGSRDTHPPLAQRLADLAASSAVTGAAR